MSENLPDELRNLIDNHIKGFNTHDNELFLSVFSDTAIVIDGIAPYRWMTPNGPEKWLADVDLWHKKFEVTDEELVFEMGIWTVEGTSAYAVISGTLTVGLGGQTMTRQGHMTYTFTKYGDTWKVDAQSWARITQPTITAAIAARKEWERTHERQEVLPWILHMRQTAQFANRWPADWNNLPTEGLPPQPPK